MKYSKWYSVTLYVNSMMEVTCILKASSHEDARHFVLTNARSMPEWRGKQLSVESMRVKDKHHSFTDKHGFIA